MAVHGGAWAIPPELLDGHRKGCTKALQLGLEILDAGGSSIDAVEAAVVYLEDDETFDAGFGSFLNVAGGVTLDAGIMDGQTLATGSVADVSGVPNPILLARRVLESPHAVLVGPGAHVFGVDHGIPVCDPETLISERERTRWEEMRTADTSAWAADLFGDTVGAVAKDAGGNLAAATSTGGSPMKPLGRVGDSPFIGAGLYANNESAAVSTTGHGELIIPLVWSKSAADLTLSGLAAGEATRGAISQLEAVGARGGLIMVDRDGSVGVAWNTPTMAYAYLDPTICEIVAGPSA
jgi:L-asparaginase / beta-aspartyl-peptidase